MFDKHSVSVNMKPFSWTNEYGTHSPGYTDKGEKHLPVKDAYWKEFDKLVAILLG